MQNYGVCEYSKCIKFQPKSNKNIPIVTLFTLYAKFEETKTE